MGSHLLYGACCICFNIIHKVLAPLFEDTSTMDKHPGGLFIEPTFSTFAFFVIDFLPQITVFLHFSESAISLKSTRVLLSGNVKNPSGALVFSSLSGLDSLCSELRQVFVGTVTGSHPCIFFFPKFF